MSKQKFNSVQLEAIAKIKCDIGVENVIIRRIAYKGWAILQPLDNLQFKEIYTSHDREECLRVYGACI